MTPIDRMKAAAEKSQAIDMWPPFAGPMPDEEIEKVATKLGVPITGSYREFIRLLGEQNDEGICGLDIEYPDGGTLWATGLMREENKLSSSYLVVWTNEAFDRACIMDCSDPQSDGEFPVYAVAPESWNTERERVADSFVEFFEKCCDIQPGA